MLLAHIYRTLEFEELKSFPRNRLIMYVCAVRIEKVIDVSIAMKKLQILYKRKTHISTKKNCVSIV